MKKKIISMLLAIVFISSTTSFSSFAVDAARGSYTPTSTETVVGDVVNLASSKIMFGANAADGSIHAAKETAGDYRFYDTYPSPSNVNIENYNLETETGSNIGSVDGATLGFKFDFGTSIYEGLSYMGGTMSNSAVVTVTVDKPINVAGSTTLAVMTLADTGNWGTFAKTDAVIDTTGISGVRTVYLNFSVSANNGTTLTFTKTATAPTARGVYTPTLPATVIGDTVNIASPKDIFGAMTDGTISEAKETDNDYRFYSNNLNGLRIENYSSTTQTGRNLGSNANTIVGFSFDFGTSKIYNLASFNVGTIDNGGTATITVDKPFGQEGAILLGTVTIISTGDWQTYLASTGTIDSTGITGVRKVYLKFNESSSNIKTLTFVEKEQVPTEPRGVYTPSTETVTGNIVNLVSSEIVFGVKPNGTISDAKETATDYRFFADNLVGPCIENYTLTTQTGSNIGYVTGTTLGFKFNFGTSIYSSFIYNAATQDADSSVIITVDAPFGQAGAITLGTVNVTNTTAWGIYADNTVSINSTSITGERLVYLNFAGGANNAKTLTFVEGTPTVEEPVVDVNPNTTDLGAIQAVILAASSAVIAFKRKNKA